MPINFPDNPSINDEYTYNSSTWIWNGTTWAASTSVESGSFITATTPPSNPRIGQGWFDPDTAQFFIYYDNSWVEVGPTLIGPSGSSGAVLSSTAPSDTSVLWIDTDDTDDPLAIPAGGTAGQSLVKSTNSDYDTQWSDLAISDVTNLQSELDNRPISPNYIINGAFDIWQRGTSFTLANDFWADRWLRYTASGTATITKETFTPAEIETNGWGDAGSYLKMNFTTGANFQGVMQRVEDVRTLAGQTVTLSFWAKGTNPGTGSINVYIDQNFGTGGSSTIRNLSVNQTLTSSWQRFTITGTLGSMVGKTIGTGNRLEVVFRQTGTASDPWELNIWGVQLEAGSVATPFRRNANSLQGELAACQRYYQFYGGEVANHTFAAGNSHSTTEARMSFRFINSMRAAPTITFAAGTSYTFQTAGVNKNGTAIAAAVATTTEMEIRLTTTGLTAGYAGNLISLSTAGTIAASAEL